MKVGALPKDGSITPKTEKWERIGLHRFAPIKHSSRDQRFQPPVRLLARDEIKRLAAAVVALRARPGAAVALGPGRR